MMKKHSKENKTKIQARATPRIYLFVGRRPFTTLLLVVVSLLGFSSRLFKPDRGDLLKENKIFVSGVQGKRYVMENTPRAQRVCIKYGSRATMLLFYTLAFLVTCRVVKVVYGGGLSSFFFLFFFVVSCASCLLFMSIFFSGFLSQLLHDPLIFLVDEPTLGLDALATHSVIQVFLDLTSRGHGVLCTIHQPSPDMFNMFSR